jgi:hypothetical protein
MSAEIPSKLIAQITASHSVRFVETIQSLWSGYGVIAKVDLFKNPEGFAEPAVIKYVSPPVKQSHKYGWQDSVSHDRKLSSYRNEFRWYNQVSRLCEQDCRVPVLYAGNQNVPNWLFVLEDLDDAGFPLRKSQINDHELDACLSWLANFHAKFLYDVEAGEPFDRTPAAKKLWPVGTYWHLETRPNEFATMPDSNLKRAAAAIDQALKNTQFQTLVHGDAKLANFCFSTDDGVAAVDFQYVGGGCGMKDLAYFVSSCFGESECDRREADILRRYFDLLKAAIENMEIPINGEQVESEWRSMYPIAWADFYRFLSGWSPGHWKMHGYSQRMADDVCKSLVRNQ